MHNPIIVALDLDSADEALKLVRRIGDAVDFYKVGMELYAAAGPDFLARLQDEGKRVFLDMKFYDIGETVKRTVAQVARRGAAFLTVHGSQAVMQAAVEGRGGTELKLLAVTVLTSFDESDLRQLGYTCSVKELVELRVRNAMTSGIDGIVCSPVEVAGVRALAGPKATLVTPGVRSTGSEAGDQKRIATPREAVQRGADYLVIGRQITRAADPAAEAARVRNELAGER
jgi:orotidine-5'-phosphate decarboxylase